MNKQLVHIRVFKEVTAHLDRWADCKFCPLHQNASQKVFFRGKIGWPNTILFIGEAPGEGEDHTGLPFVGDAGAILQEIIDKTIGEFNKVHHEFRTFSFTSTCYHCEQPLTKVTSPYCDKRPLLNELSYVLTNTVCCRPESNRDPTREERSTCLNRLAEFIKIAKPKLLVNVGKHASLTGMALVNHLNPMPRFLDVMHPARFVYMSDPDYEKKNVIVNLKAAIRNIFGSPKPSSLATNDIPF